MYCSDYPLQLLHHAEAVGDPILFRLLVYDHSIFAIIINILGVTLFHLNYAKPANSVVCVHHYKNLNGLPSNEQATSAVYL
jgi:hypothetical protein